MASSPTAFCVRGAEEWHQVALIEALPPPRQTRAQLATQGAALQHKVPSLKTWSTFGGGELEHGSFK